MSADDRIADQVLDLVLYVPIGLALEARELIPKLADRGRGQVALTRLAGKVAADRGQAEARKLFDQLVGLIGTVVADSGPEPTITDDPRLRVVGDDRGLPIEHYDTLSAPQLLPHLEPLSADELEQVLDYEEAHRSRATVINRIRQLQG